MANQEKTDKRIMEVNDLCKELNQKLREQKQFSSYDSIIINNPQPSVRPKVRWTDW